MTACKGSSEQGYGPFLGAGFWKEGVTITGEVLWPFDSENGRCYSLQLVKPVELDGEPYDTVAVGALRGFVAAVRAALRKSNPHELRAGDKVVIQCTGSRSTGKESEMVMFDVEVTR